jgi:hypothetical protein
MARRVDAQIRGAVVVIMAENAAAFRVLLRKLTSFAARRAWARRVHNGRKRKPDS